MRLRFTPIVCSTFIVSSSFVFGAPGELPAAGAEEPTKPTRAALVSAKLSNRHGAEPEFAEAPSVPLPLPPLPPGVEELNFAEFFKTPVGPLGLEITERLQHLDGRRVRILGHMVQEDLTPCNSCPVIINKGKRALPAWLEMTVPGRMMFTAAPSTVSHAHYGLADDLPPQTIFVTVPDRFGELVPFTPGPMLLTGVLSVGPRAEADGRNSVVRLTLDAPQKLSPPNTPTANQTQPTPTK